MNAVLVFSRGQSKKLHPATVTSFGLRFALLHASMLASSHSDTAGGVFLFGSGRNH